MFFFREGVMSMNCKTDHGFRYRVEVKDHRKKENEASCLEGWYRVVWLMMGVIFLLFLFIML
jgi:hypothetical protein